MLARSVKFAHVALLGFAVLVSVLFLREMEQQIPLESSSHVMVEDNPSQQQASGAQVSATMERVAREQGVTVARQTVDLAHPESQRHLYLALGDREGAPAEWLRSGYPSFSSDMRTAVHPIGAARDLEPRGEYVVFGAPQAGPAFAAALQPLGFHARVQPMSLGTWVAESVTGASTEVLVWCLLAVLLAAVIAVGAGVVLNARGYGVLRLHGYGFGRIVWRDLVQLGTFWVRAAAAITVGTLLGLWFYNGLAALELFITVAGAVLGLFVVVAVVAHLIALALTYRISVLGALKGEISAPWTLVSVYAVRIVAALLVITVAGAVARSGQRMAQYQSTRDAYAQIGHATHVSLKGRVSPREVERMENAVGSWLHRLDRDGHMVLAVNQNRLGDDSRHRWKDPHRNILVVNQTYLNQQTILDGHGHPVRVGNHQPHTARVLIPRSLPDNPATVANTVTRRFRMGHTAHGLSTHAKPLDVQTVPMQAGQHVFTYGAGVGNKVEYRTFLQDPIVVVLPDSPSVLNNDSYMAYATQGYVAVSDPQYVQQALRDPQLRGYLYGMQPVAQEAATRYRDVAREMRLAVLDAAMTLGVLALTGVAVAVVYTRRGAQRVFVRYISGWTFTKTHRLLIGAESALAAVLVGATAWDAWSTMRAEQASPSTLNPLPLGGWEPVVMLGVTGTGVGITLATVAVLQRRLVRTRSAET